MNSRRLRRHSTRSAGRPAADLRDNIARCWKQVVTFSSSETETEKAEDMEAHPRAGLSRQTASQRLSSRR